MCIHPKPKTQTLNAKTQTLTPRFPRTIVGMVVGKKTVPGTGVSDSRVPCSHVPGGLYHPDRIRAYFTRVVNHREGGPARARPSTQSRSLLLRRGAVLRNTKTAPYHLSRRMGPHMSIETISRRKCSKCRKMHLRANGKSRNSRSRKKNGCSREKTCFHADFTHVSRCFTLFHAVSRGFFAKILFEQKAVRRKPEVRERRESLQICVNHAYNRKTVSAPRPAMGRSNVACVLHIHWRLCSFTAGQFVSPVWIHQACA